MRARPEENDLLGIPASALRADLTPRSALTPWLLEGSLAGAGAVGIGLSGVATTTQELATILFSLSLGGLVVLLLAETRARRRWMLR